MTQTPTKECFKCHETKPLTAFYAHPQMADGRLGKCKDCMKADVRKNYRDNIEHYQEYERGRASLPHRVKAREEYAATEEGRAAGNRAKEAWEKRNPEKKKACTTLNNAIRDGKLTRGTKCSICESTRKVEAHHEDYSKPLEVIWLCKKHHREADEKRQLRELTAQNVAASEQLPERV